MPTTEERIEGLERKLEREKEYERRRKEGLARGAEVESLVSGLGEQRGELAALKTEMRAKSKARVAWVGGAGGSVSSFERAWPSIWKRAKRLHATGALRGLQGHRKHITL
jgi:hypothetical protein